MAAKKGAESSPLTFDLKADLIAVLDKYQKQLGVSKSEIIRHAIAGFDFPVHIFEHLAGGINLGNIFQAQHSEESDRAISKAGRVVRESVRKKPLQTDG